MKKVWGIALLLMGAAMFFTIPSKARQIQEIRELSGGTLLMMKFCFYIISILLMGGGVQKLKGSHKEDS
ncbi:hypothetical protein [Desulfoluna sp.]|uniref:hypothetical protein n=1 Tax=Desulfoluna sp. TaxID=2045199 RepID=UPI00261D6B5A|nr:hypothetical protein [Desulfoluna sp.]